MANNKTNDGLELSKTLLKNNEGDYLTNKVAKEIETIANELEKVTNAVNDVETSVAAERKRLAELAKQKEKEKEEEKKKN